MDEIRIQPDSEIVRSKRSTDLHAVIAMAVLLSSWTWTVQTSASDSTVTLDPTPTESKAFVPILSDEEVWEKLPALASGTKQRLPSWARAIAVQMPRTAAAMLELDAAHRLRSPLDPSLRASLRWVVAHSNKCAYSEAYAIADLRRAGADSATIERLTNDKYQGTDVVNDALEFARLLTIAAPTIPDSLFARLRSQYGDRGVASMVLLAAYGNFQDRIVLGLNLPMEVNGPIAPCDVRFVEGALQLSPLMPSANGQAVYIDSTQSVVPRDDAWMFVSYNQLQSRLIEQQDRTPRLPVPTWDDVKSKLPAAMSASPTSIRWSLMNYGYAHELAIPWTLATRTHWAENPAERILEESLFWVQTRAIDCNYCMGHCEMLLEVAGLNRPAIAKRTQMLAETDWASFPPAEQRAYAYARKLSRTPWEMSSDDYKSLESDWGSKKAMGLFWWMCRGLYMTRISDGFQLPLERDNVFGGPPPETKPTEVQEDELTPAAEAIVQELRASLPKDSEAIAMLEGILDGSRLGAEDGWFKLSKAQSRFGWNHVRKRFDTDQDDKVTATEFTGGKADFSRLDRNDDGQLTESDFDWSKHSLTATPGFMMFFMADRDANGKLTREEFLNLFEELGADEDGYLAIDDLREKFLPPTPGESVKSAKRPDQPSRSTLLAGLKNQELGSLQPGPSLDEQAPDFTLTTLDGQPVTLSKEIGEKPIVLIFGNFTCGPFRSQAGNIEKLYERYQDRAKFFLVYVREAHPSDGWWMTSNQRAGIDLSQPKMDSERRLIARTCQKHLDIDIPFLVDGVDDAVGSLYSGMPNRLYLIDQTGRIAFKNGRGPFGFHPRQLEQSLVLLLNDKK
jgi:alkylhydroperoxidase family enzyme/thiol-disulfide isomerase/thioredoxin